MVRLELVEPGAEDDPEAFDEVVGLSEQRLRRIAMRPLNFEVELLHQIVLRREVVVRGAHGHPASWAIRRIVVWS